MAAKKRENLVDVDLSFALNFAVQNEQKARTELAHVLK